MKTDGCHVVADVTLAEYFFTCDNIIQRVEAALAKSGMTILGKATHDFGGGGFTGVWLLAESHFSIHTFPERNFISIDCYTCGNNGKPLVCVAAFIDEIEVQDAKMRILHRGA